MVSFMVERLQMCAVLSPRVAIKITLYSCRMYVSGVSVVLTSKLTNHMFIFKQKSMCIPSFPSNCGDLLKCCACG